MTATLALTRYVGNPIVTVILRSPIPGKCTLGFGALSYNGCLAITAGAHAGHVPDLDVVVQGMPDSWGALEQAVRVAEAAS